MRRAVFRLTGWVLLAAALGGAGAPHRHAGIDDESGVPAERVLTTHSGRSPVFHWHAVVRIVQSDPCWACHWQRHFGLTAVMALAFRLFPGQIFDAVPPAAAAAVARFTRHSRGPPALF